MFEYIINSTIFMKTIVACCFLGVISWFILEISYRSMIKSTAQIGKTKKKWLVSLKKRYEDYHEMNVKVNNEKKDTGIDLFFLADAGETFHSRLRHSRSSRRPGGIPAGCASCGCNDIVPYRHNCRLQFAVS